jgi:lipopolysaccharide export system permease protein
VNLGIVGYVQPVARFAYEELRFELRSGALGASIKVGEFNKLGKDMTLRIDKSEEQGRKLSGIFVMARQPGGKSLSVAAEHGQFLATDDRDVIILRLSNGTLIHDQPGFRTPRVLTFTSHDLPIDLPKMEAFRKRGEKETEMTLPQLAQTGGDKDVPLNIRNEARSNFHYRLAEVMMMLLLPLLAIALAVPPKRSTSALGVFVSIVMVVTYHKINEYAQGLGGALGIVDPFFALWVPFALFAALIVWMYYTIAFVPGGQPIGAVDRLAGKAAKAFRNIFAKKR